MLALERRVVGGGGAGWAIRQGAGTVGRFPASEDRVQGSHAVVDSTWSYLWSG